MQTRFPTPTERQKRARLLSLLDDGMVLVRIDATHEGVDVPEHLRGTPGLALNLSYRFRAPVFEVGPFAVQASLSFGGDRHLCVLPYDAIYLLQSHATGTVVVFPEDAPVPFRDVLRRAAAQAEALPDDAPSILETSTEATPSAAKAPKSGDEPASPPQGRPHLRLVD